LGLLDAGDLCLSAVLLARVGCASRADEQPESDRGHRRHDITYDQWGFLLFRKSSVTGDLLIPKSQVKDRLSSFSSESVRVPTGFRSGNCEPPTRHALCITTGPVGFSPAPAGSTVTK